MRRRLFSAIGLAAAAIAIVSTGGAEAGLPVPTRDVIVNVSVGGSQAPSAATYAPTFTPNGLGESFGCTTVATTPSGFFTLIEYSCTLAIGDTYTVSVPAPPDPFVVVPRCSDDTGSLAVGDQLVVPEGTDEIGCIIGVAAPTVIVEKRVVGEAPEPLDVSDFLIEVYPAEGGSPVGSAIDPDPTECSTPDEVGLLCGYIEVPVDGSADFVLGERREYGYFPVLATCRTEPFGDGGDGDGGPIIINPLEMLDPAEYPEAAFTLDTAAPGGPFIFCIVLNAYVEGTIEITKTVINDDGGTATPDDWTVELYDDTMTQIDSAVCNADGTCLSGTYPIGEYTVGEEGPDGYTSSVSVEITEPDVLTEIIDDPNAVFELPPLGLVEVEIVSDDQPATTTTTTVPPTTTTTTTTTVAPTTAAPTTAAPTTAAPTTIVTTTAFDAGAGTLPATGDSGSRNVAMIALLLFGLGLIATRLARR